VFRDVLNKEFGTYTDLPKLNLDELSLNEEIPSDELKFFVDSIKNTLGAFNNHISTNEATIREYVSIFMKTAVVYVKNSINPSAQLSVEVDLDGSRAYGPVDYLVKLNDKEVLINEAKVEDISKGIAQNIMQLHTAKEVMVSFHHFCIYCT